MNTAYLIENYSPVGDIITIVSAAILWFVIIKVLYFSEGSNFVFLKRSLFFIMLGAASNVAYYYSALTLEEYHVLLFLFRDIYHISFLCCLYCFLLYMKKMLDVDGIRVGVITHLTRFVFCVCMILDLLSPVTRMGLCIIDGKWHDSMVSSYNFFYIYTLILMGIMLFMYRDRMIKYVRLCLVGTEALIAIIMIYQIIQNTNSYTSFTYILPILVVLIMLHSKPFDAKTGSLSSGSFDSFLLQSFKKKQSVDYLVLKLYMSIVETLPDELGKVLNSFWHDYLKEALLFELSSDLYVLAVPRKDKNGNTEEKIKEMVTELFPGYYDQYKITYKIVELFDIDFAEGVTDILGMLKYLFENMEENSIFALDEKKKEQLHFYKYLRNQLADIEKLDNLDDPRVLAYCQPIRNMKTGKYDTAEALMRLTLPEYGFVMPGMFIELAEQYDHIHALTRIILNKVCKQIIVLEKEGFSFERISLNFAASEMKADGFCEEILGIIRANGVSPSKIGVEITESQTEKDFVLIQRVINRLRDEGMTIYLDDVGTGYSNLDRIVKYDVDVAKFDRFFVLEAEKNIKNVKMLSHLSQAFRDLDYKLLYEGVETDNQEAICLNCGADYIQGYKYSQTIPIEKLNTFLTPGGDTYDRGIGAQNVNNVKIEDIREFSLQDIQDQYGILLTLAKLFYSMHIIDLINNTAKPYNPTEDVRVVDVVNSSAGADEMMRQIMTMCTKDEYIDAVLKFSDIKSIPERMKGKKIIESDVYEGKSIGPYVAAFYTIEADAEGRPTKVLYTTRNIISK